MQWEMPEQNRCQQFSFKVCKWQLIGPLRNQPSKVSLLSHNSRNENDTFNEHMMIKARQHLRISTFPEPSAPAVFENVDSQLTRLGSTLDRGDS